MEENETTNVSQEELTNQALASALSDVSMLKAQLAAMTAARDDLAAEFEKVKYLVTENYELRMTQKPLIEAVGAEVVRRLDKREWEMERREKERREYAAEAVKLAEQAAADAATQVAP